MWWNLEENIRRRRVVSSFEFGLKVKMRTEKGSQRRRRGHWRVQHEVSVAWFQWLGWKLTGVGLGGNEI